MIPASKSNGRWQRFNTPQAWTTTKGSNEIVVAILDSGVEYAHANLANNIWTRPASLQPYQDRDLGAVDDVLGCNFAASGGPGGDGAVIQWVIR